MRFYPGHRAGTPGLRPWPNPTMDGLHAKRRHTWLADLLPPKGGVVRGILKWTGILLGALGLAVVVFVTLFDINQLRGPISREISRQLGRPFAIRGDLAVDWSWTPKLTVNDIVLDNAPWSRQPAMFTLDRAEVSLRIPELWHGHLVLPEIRLVKPRVLLEKSAKGQANWEFKPTATPSAPLNPRWFPKIDRLLVEDGRFLYRDPVTDTDLDVNLATALGAGNDRALTLDGQGRLRKERFTLEARGGAITTLWAGDKPFPVALEIAYGPTRAKVSGSFAEPLRLLGPELRFEARGPNLAALRPFSPAWLPRTPAYRFAGAIRRDGERWLIRDFEGRLGGSDLSGDFAFGLRQGRPLLDGDVVSKTLDFRDFAGFIGANPDPDAPPRPRLLPDEPYDLEGLRAADADIRFRSANIVTPMMPLDEVSAHVRLDHGRLSLKPANVTIGLGRITSSAVLDATGQKIQVNLDSQISRVPFQKLLAKTPFGPETQGLFYGRVAIDTVGNSVADMAAAANGGITLVMERGRISELLMELIGLDIAESLNIVVAKGDRSVAIRCAVQDFIVTAGVVKTQLFLLDTTDTQVGGEGWINLRDETLRFRLAAHPKDISVFSARTPVIVEGTLKKPSGHPEILPLAARGVASVALGVLNPAAAILPWLELGLGQDSPCRAVVEAAKKSQRPPKPKR